jgi:hypothetical protein
LIRAVSTIHGTIPVIATQSVTILISEATALTTKPGALGEDSAVVHPKATFAEWKTKH